MSRVRALFLGTPEFARLCLESLAKDPHFEVVAVVTQPDRPKGRDLKLQPSPVKQWALQQGLKVLTPEKVNTSETLSQLQELKAEVAVVVAFGQILSNAFLELFPFGAVNIHGSLLPNWRGAAPIQRGIQAGDTEGGVTLQKIVKELDAGDIIGVRKINIPMDLSAIEVHDQLAQLSCDLLEIELMDYIRGHLVPRAQNHALATYAPKISKAETEINWELPALTIHNQIRAFTMGPGSWTSWQDKRIKIWKTWPHDSIKSLISLTPGTVFEYQESILVQTSFGCLQLIELQLEGKKRMLAKDWWKSLGSNKVNFNWSQRTQNESST